MSEIVERVARVLRAIDFTVGSPNYSQVAHALIEAMREPTEAMKAVYGDADTDEWREAMPEDVWQAMIDAALRPQERDPA